MMRPFHELIDFSEAKRIIMEHAKPVESTESVPLLDAANRILANETVAEVNVPGFTRAAMDGYAVIADDTYGSTHEDPKSLELLGAVFAGHQPEHTVEVGKCVQIATGAPMPDGADAVVMVEYTEKKDNEVLISKPVYPDQNVSRPDSDIKKGDLLFRGGEFITPARLGVLAALGHKEVLVRRRPKAMIFPTGDEVIPQGQELEIGQVYDINSFTVAALMKRCGAEVVVRQITGDTVEELCKHLELAKSADVVLFSGGSSVGERDLLDGAITEMGQLLFHGVALKPGKPTMFGMVGDAMVFGLPGYPMSCLTNAYVLLAPAVRKLSGYPDLAAHASGKMSKKVVSTIGRHQILTVNIENGVVIPIFKESGSITSISLANGYIEIPANVEFVAEGAEVDVTLF